MENGDDFGAQLSVHHKKILIQPILFSEYSITELEAPRGRTEKGKTAKDLQMYISVPQEEYNNLASCICQICIYRDKVAD